MKPQWIQLFSDGIEWNINESNDTVMALNETSVNPII
jgi:hypothetical protein